MKNRSRCVWVLMSAATVASGCGDAALDGDVGRVSAAITSVPSGVLCVRLAVRAGAATTATNRNFVVAAGGAATLDLGIQPSGAIVVTPAAYGVACGSVANATVPTWVGEPVAATVRTGYGLTLAFTLRPNAGTTATVDFVNPVRELFSGPATLFAVMQDGTVRAWGAADGPIPGLSPTVRQPTPMVVAGLTDVRQIAGGTSSACALRNDGTASCWGYNFRGSLGDGTTTPHTQPAPVTMPAGVLFSSVSANIDAVCAIARSGAPSPVYCWGTRSGPGALLGNGAPGFTLVPTPLNLGEAATPDAVVINATSTCVLNSSLRCFGRNDVGAWGTGDTLDSPTFTGTGFDLATTVSYTVGGHLCAVRPDGSVWCAGANDYGQLGNGTTTQSLVPVRVSSSDGFLEAASVAVTATASCALRPDGRVSCWGGGRTGVLGNRNNQNQSSPVEVYGLTGVTRLVGTQTSMCALKADGTVWCWGENSYGELGDGTTHLRVAPVRALL